MSQTSVSMVAQEIDIYEISAYFPLPMKDPLISHRHMYDIASAFGLHTRCLLRYFRLFFFDSLNYVLFIYLNKNMYI
jgi:hypothetical protein